MTPSPTTSAVQVEDLSAVTFRGRPGLELRRHEHERALVLVMLDGGFDEETRRHPVLVRPGVARFSPPGDRHDLRFGDAGGVCLMVHLPERMTRQAPIQERRYSRNPWLGELSREILELLAEPPAPAELPMLELPVLELLAQGRRPPRGADTAPPSWLLGLRDRLHDDPVAFPSLDDIAQLTRHHPTHVARSFRLHFGHSVAQYARRLRLQAAHRAICDTDAPLADIAQRTGFCDQSHMTRWFRRELGVAPGSLRGPGSRVRR